MTFTASTPLRQRTAYKALQQHYESVKDEHLKDLFAADPTRGTALTLEAEGIYLDYSKQRVTAETIGLLVDLARESGLAELRALASDVPTSRSFVEELLAERRLSAASE